MKILIKIKHFFTGHGLLIDYDDKYLYCDCGKKIEHYGREIVRDWVFPYIDKEKEYKKVIAKKRFGYWFFKWNSKRVKKIIDKIDLDVKDIKIIPQITLTSNK